MLLLVFSLLLSGDLGGSFVWANEAEIQRPYGGPVEKPAAQEQTKKCEAQVRAAELSEKAAQARELARGVLREFREVATEQKARELGLVAFAKLMTQKAQTTKELLAVLESEPTSIAQMAAYELYDELDEIIELVILAKDRSRTPVREVPEQNPEQSIEASVEKDERSKNDSIDPMLSPGLQLKRRFETLDALLERIKNTQTNDPGQLALEVQKASRDVSYQIQKILIQLRAVQDEPQSLRSGYEKLIAQINRMTEFRDLVSSQTIRMTFDFLEKEIRDQQTLIVSYGVGSELAQKFYADRVRGDVDWVNPDTQRSKLVLFALDQSVSFNEMFLGLDKIDLAIKMLQLKINVESERKINLTYDDLQPTAWARPLAVGAHAAIKGLIWGGATYLGLELTSYMSNFVHITAANPWIAGGVGAVATLVSAVIGKNITKPNKGVKCVADNKIKINKVVDLSVIKNSKQLQFYNAWLDRGFYSEVLDLRLSSDRSKHRLDVPVWEWLPNQDLIADLNSQGVWADIKRTDGISEKSVLSSITDETDVDAILVELDTKGIDRKTELMDPALTPAFVQTLMRRLQLDEVRGHWDKPETNDLLKLIKQMAQNGKYDFKRYRLPDVDLQELVKKHTPVKDSEQK